MYQLINLTREIVAVYQGIKREPHVFEANATLAVANLKDYDYLVVDGIMVGIPVYGKMELPDYQPGVYYIVDRKIGMSARVAGRTTEDFVIVTGTEEVVIDGTKYNIAQLEMYDAPRSITEYERPRLTGTVLSSELVEQDTPKLIPQLPTNSATA